MIFYDKMQEHNAEEHNPSLTVVTSVNTKATQCNASPCIIVNQPLLLRNYS